MKNIRAFFRAMIALTLSASLLILFGCNANPNSSDGSEPASSPNESIPPVSDDAEVSTSPSSDEGTSATPGADSPVSPSSNKDTAATSYKATTTTNQPGLTVKPGDTTTLKPGATTKKTTKAPTTKAPTTKAPTTKAPTTKAPTTKAPTSSTPKLDPVITPQASVITDLYSAFKAKTFKASNGLTLPYRIYVPADYDEKYAYPVVLFLHGAGERGSNNDRQLHNAAPQMFKDKNSPYYQSIIVSPQCPSDDQWVNTPWADGNYSVDKIPLSKPLAATLELLDSIHQTYSTNLNRQYVIGLSMGGFGTWDLIMRYPNRFAAAVPICGGADPAYAGKLVNMPIHTFHGYDDTVVPAAGTQAMVQAIKNAGGKLLKYTESGGNHYIWDYALSYPGLSDWLFSQRKGS